MALNPLLSAARSKAAANRMAKQLDVSDLEKVINHLQSALTAAKKREAKKAAAKQAADLKKLKAIVAKMDLSAADIKKLIAAPPKLKAGTKQPKAKRKTRLRRGKKVAPKYQLKVGNQTHKWTGRGRMPLVFKDYIESGESLDSCLISKSQ